MSKEAFSASRYTVEVFYSAEDGGYVAVVPDLPGCMAFDERRVGAMTEVEDAITAWLEAAAEAGMPIPDASPSQYDLSTRHGGHDAT
jgi:predicted RNase H-like HicB family nuclease